MTENRLQSSTRTVNKRLSNDEREFLWKYEMSSDVVNFYIFTMCVYSRVSSIAWLDFSYDGIPKDGAFLTSERAPVPGQKIDCSRQSVTVTRLSLQNLSRQRNGNFRRSFAELWLTTRSLAPGPGWKATPLSGKCWLRLGFPVPGPGVQAESPEAGACHYIAMSVSDVLSNEQSPVKPDQHRQSAARQIRLLIKKYHIPKRQKINCPASQIFFSKLSFSFIKAKKSFCFLPVVWILPCALIH